MDLKVNSENHSGKVAGVYEQQTGAQQAIDLLCKQGGFSAEEVYLVPPNDANFDEKIEPDDKGIGRTLLGSHVILGGSGLVVGLIVAAILSVYGPALTTSSPLMVFIGLATLGTFLGLLLAGLVSLRPDHDGLINTTRHATNNQQWTVIVQTKDDAQQQQARQLMQSTAVSVSHSF